MHTYVLVTLFLHYTEMSLNVMIRAQMCTFTANVSAVVIIMHICLREYGLTYIPSKWGVMAKQVALSMILARHVCFSLWTTHQLLLSLLSLPS